MFCHLLQLPKALHVPCLLNTVTTGNWGGPSVQIEIGSGLRMGESSEMKRTCIRLGGKMSDYLSLIISVLDKLLRGLFKP